MFERVAVRRLWRGMERSKGLVQAHVSIHFSTLQGGVNMKRIPHRYKFLGLQARYGATFGRYGAGWWRRGPRRRTFVYGLGPPSVKPLSKIKR